MTRPPGMNSRFFSILVLLTVSAFAETAGRHFYVDPVLGKESADGLAATATGADGPVKTIARGLKFAQPGDTVHLAKATYRESAVFFNRQGEPDRPITLDGHGATLDGSEPLDPAQWQETAPGLFQCSDLLRHDDAVIQRWFFLQDGQPNHMGRTSKGARVPLKPVADLQPGEWTYVKDPASVPGDKHGDRGTFFIKLAPGQKLADAHLAAPLRSAGVQFSGTNQWLVIRNLTATHVYNDGFNIHGHCAHCVFENIRAIECGDDGISAHEDCQYRVDGFTSIGNSTGICDTGASVTDYHRVFIRDCLGVDLFFLDTGRHSITDAIVHSSAIHALNVSGSADAPTPCSLRLENVFISRLKTPETARLSKNSRLEASHVSFVNLSIQAPAGELRLTDSVIMEAEIVLGTDLKWQANHNRYAVHSIKVGARTYQPTEFSAYQTETTQDAASEWERTSMEKNGFPGGTGDRGASSTLLDQLPLE
jgi:hypothetical protein